MDPGRVVIAVLTHQSECVCNYSKWLGNLSLKHSNGREAESIDYIVIYRAIIMCMKTAEVAYEGIGRRPDKQRAHC